MTADCTRLGRVHGFCLLRLRKIALTVPRRTPVEAAPIVANGVVYRTGSRQQGLSLQRRRPRKREASTGRERSSDETLCRAPQPFRESARLTRRQP